MTTTDKELIDLGFAEYSPSQFDHDGIIKNFQKKYTDGNKTLFFLTISKWDWTRYGDIPDSYTYEIKTQLYTKGNHEAINIEFGNGVSVEQAEDFIFNMFKAKMIEPYEEE